MFFRALLLVASLTLLHFPSPAVSLCTGNSDDTALYALTLQNFATRRNFSVLPRSGLVFSPPVAISHGNRVTFFILRGMASQPVRILAEQGLNGPLIRLARGLRSSGLVRSVINFRTPTMPGSSATMRIRVDCERPFISFAAMLAPSPDWIVARARENMLNPAGRFRGMVTGPLFTYDSGTDSGGDFTPPSDLSLDIPTVPQQNIVPLREDDTDVFDGEAVGRFILRRIM